MKLMRRFKSPPYPATVVAIGAFDGLHRGHAAIVAATMRQAHQQGGRAVIVTFEPLPREFLYGEQAPPRLMRLREKVAVLASWGLDAVVALPFDHGVAHLPAPGFVQELLVGRLGIRGVVVGHDFRFGYKRQGDISLMQQLGEEHGFTVTTVAPVQCAGERISSTQLRSALGAGHLERARQLLGRTYALCGRVVRGAGLGRQLGFPTANLRIQHRLPLSGIFVVMVEGIGPAPMQGVASLGVRPTVGGQGTLLEVHLLDFPHERDLYGYHITCHFLHKLRDEEHFPSLEVLIEAIAADVAEAKAYFAAHPVIETRLHEGWSLPR
jgi:riboflavin kinase/FMN adenylyltransferase